LLNNGLAWLARVVATPTKWYEVAAEQGYSKAQHNLAVMYVKGYGVAQNYVTAHMWFNLAAANGEVAAIKGRDDLAKLMTPQQIAQAQQLASNCLASNYKDCD